MKSNRPQRSATTRLARLVLAAFLLTFIAARILVLLIMTHRIPDLFLHVGGTHIHHLNYGIFLLAGVGAYLIFVRPNDTGHRISALVYGIGLALTFDEFGMWLHLGGAYWQRASFDAIVVIGGILALLAYAPWVAQFTSRQWVIAGTILALLIVFCYLTSNAIKDKASLIKGELHSIELESPP